MSDRGKGRLANPEEEEIKRLLLGIMEGYRDAVIPPLSYFSNFPGNSSVEKGSSSRKRQSDEASLAESLYKERQRREQMSQKFCVLRSMVPTLFEDFKPPKEKIIGDTVDYIKYLEAEKKRLEALKKFQWKEPKAAKPVSSKCPNSNSSVKVTVSNDATFFAIQLPFRRGLVPKIVMVFEKHKAEVLEARVSVDDQQLLTFTATIMLECDGGSTVDKIREEILQL